MTDQEWDRIVGVVARETSDADAQDVPQRLCDAVLKLLPVSGASVSLRGEGMPVPLGASGESAAYVLEMEVTLGDGPGLEAAETGVVVVAPDLTSRRDAGRWPVFAQQAAAAGVRSVYALPLGDRAVCVGTLDLYRDVPGELAVGEVRTARVVADVVTAALLALPRDEQAGPGGDEGLWLSPLATDHGEVYQAVGMLMAQLGVPADEALALLRGHAFAGDRTVLELAHDVVEHRTRFDDDPDF
ncbi:GAF and ANTAR domain-containing protein [Streptomyces sp. ID05-04B]|uniref:GAF and ANTAR domain-containing protein n=1 Tax=unclassified Streptomyces TaxID=2593676 RepID=UPI000D1A0216|nr:MULTISPECIES: GAF and ANTAR domain-containing protein [unclassified Streptomyces]AVV41754.1 diguanylate cyclase [Streptomyces sp. P3]MDX5568728.1 GAF and ANTAR domain-containing protein [Streptomyces sp. ID05-04B]